MAVKVREKPKGSGVWWLLIDHRGKRKAKKVGNDKRLALELAKKVEAKLVLNEYGLDQGGGEPATPLFKVYASVWLEDYVKPLRRATTYERYEWVLRKYVFPVLGDMPLAEVKRGDVRSILLSHFKKGLSRSSVCLIRDVISGVMGYAVDEELLPANPVTGITKRLGLERGGKRTKFEPFTPEEAHLFLDAALEGFRADYPMFLAMFRTGMRLGEVLGLHWGDIDWNGKFILVQRSYKNQKINPTKTGRTRRVDMSDQLLETLRGLYRQRKAEALHAGQSEVVPFVFHRKGEPMAQNSVRNTFKRILRKAGLRDFRIHDIRHTFASLLLTNGQSPVYVKEQLGHSSIQMTVDIYGHLIPSANREAVNQLDQAATIRNPGATAEKKKAVTN